MKTKLYIKNLFKVLMIILLLLNLYWLFVSELSNFARAFVMAGAVLCSIYIVVGILLRKDKKQLCYVVPIVVYFLIFLVYALFFSNTIPTLNYLLSAITIIILIVDLICSFVYVYRYLFRWNKGIAIKLEEKNVYSLISLYIVMYSPFISLLL